MDVSLPQLLDFLTKASYFLAALLFILGLMKMGSPVTAKKGIRWAGVGMVLATVVTFVAPGTWGAHGSDQFIFGAHASPPSCAAETPSGTPCGQPRPAGAGVDQRGTAGQRVPSFLVPMALAAGRGCREATA